MPDLLRHIPALEGITSGRHGTRDGAPGVTLRALPEGALLLVLGRIGLKELAGATAHAGFDDVVVSEAGFEQWLIVGDVAATPAHVAALGAALSALAHVSDQSQGRIRMALSGPRSLAVLAKGCGIDFAVFPPGAGAMTLYGHIGCHLHRVDGETFNLT
ncbi:MAG TPA: sarcosine oxidase subunit gamma, partial [Rhabdaerophilum sp.]|nr:sarcosine oxidase subunit gamma [Rhabdaerophilum sp.]